MVLKEGKTEPCLTRRRVITRLASHNQHSTFSGKLWKREADVDKLTKEEKKKPAHGVSKQQLLPLV